MMDQWDIGLAKMFKEKGNKGTKFDITIGKVISGFPNVVVQIGDDILLDNELIISNRLYNMHTHAEDEYHTPIPITLSADDMVILIPSANGQTYYLVDKVGE